LANTDEGLTSQKILDFGFGYTKIITGITMKNKNLGKQKRLKYYLRLRELIVKDEVLLLIHKKYKGIRKLFIYSLCGISYRYFDRAYKEGKVILQFKSGLRVGKPLSWEKTLEDYDTGKIV